MIVKSEAAQMSIRQILSVQLKCTYRIYTGLTAGS